MSVKSFISKGALSQNICSLWNKYDRNGNGKLEYDEFKDLLCGCAKNFGYKLAVKAFGRKIFNNLKQYSKNNEESLTKTDVFTYAKNNNIKINEKDTINKLIDMNIYSLNKVV